MLYLNNILSFILEEKYCKYKLSRITSIVGSDKGWLDSEGEKEKIAKLKLELCLKLKIKYVILLSQFLARYVFFKIQCVSLLEHFASLYI